MSDDAAAPAPDAAAHDAGIAAVARHHGADADALLREVSAFRVALDADLTVAAAAARESASIAAADPVVHTFEEQLLERVARDRRSTRAPRFPVQARRAVAATSVAALLALGSGAAYASRGVDRRSPARPAPAAGSPSALVAVPWEAAASQADALDDAVADHASAAAIAAAATALHATLAGLLDRVAADPALADQLWLLVEQEQATLAALGSDDPAIVAAVSAAQGLLVRLAAIVPIATRHDPVLPPVVSVPTVASATPSTPAPMGPTAPSAAPSSPAVAPSTATGTAPPSLLVLPSPTSGGLGTGR